MPINLPQDNIFTNNTPMFEIRNATELDLIEIQGVNLLCLPENYPSKFYHHQLLSWPQLSIVALDQGKVVGYVLAQMLNDGGDIDYDTTPHGEVVSIAVLRSHRKLGIATKLLRAVHNQLVLIYDACYSTLWVRAVNLPAFQLYQSVGYRIQSFEKDFYADDEDAYEMIFTFRDETVEETHLNQGRGRASPPKIMVQIPETEIGCDNDNGQALLGGVKTLT